MRSAKKQKGKVGGASPQKLGLGEPTYWNITCYKHVFLSHKALLCKTVNESVVT